MCGAVNFWPHPTPAVLGKCQACDILCKYTPMEFTIKKSRAMTLQQVPAVCRAFGRAVMGEKSLSPLFPVGGQGVWGGGDSGYKWGVFPFCLLSICLHPFCLLPFHLLSNFTSFPFHLQLTFVPAFDVVMVKHAMICITVWLFLMTFIFNIQPTMS